MKVIVTVLALAATVLASPAEVKRQACTPATYSCTPDDCGWQVCDTSGNWEVNSFTPIKICTQI
jgi:hypothetical protein